ncbi:MAG: hypothetical protein WC872_04110 [Candidatus Absconditabacterales bacterium]
MAKPSLSGEGFTAHEIENLKKLSSKEMEDVRKTFRKFDSMYPSIQAYKIIVILSIIGIIIIGYLGLETYRYAIAGIALVISYGQIKGKLGEENGYLEGYQDGVDKGVNKTLGLTEEDEEFISEVISGI